MVSTTPSELDDSLVTSSGAGERLVSGDATLDIS